MSKRSCGRKGCDRPHEAFGWCKNHYNLVRKYGSPDGPPAVADLPGERWLPVVDFEGLYEVSSLGRVQSLTRYVPCGNGHTRIQFGGLLSQSLNSHGYWQVMLSRDGESTLAVVHRLVGEAFIGPLREGMVTRHGPAGQRVNAVTNLSYGTPLQNAGDRKRDNTDPLGSARPNAKLTEDIVRACRLRHAAGGVTIKALACEFGVSFEGMRRAIIGETWRHVDAGSV